MFKNIKLIAVFFKILLALKLNFEFLINVKKVSVEKMYKYFRIENNVHTVKII